MKPKILVTAKVNPDLDGTACALFYCRTSLKGLKMLISSNI